MYGLTTAASLWATAAVGMHCGGVNRSYGKEMFQAPIAATCIILFFLQALIHIEVAIHRCRGERAPSTVARLVHVSSKFREDLDRSCAAELRFDPTGCCSLVLAWQVEIGAMLVQ